MFPSPPEREYRRYLSYGWLGYLKRPGPQIFPQWRILESIPTSLAKAGHPIELESPSPLVRAQPRHHNQYPIAAAFEFGLGHGFGSDLYIISTASGDYWVKRIDAATGAVSFFSDRLGSSFSTDKGIGMAFDPTGLYNYDLFFSAHL